MRNSNGIIRIPVNPWPRKLPTKQRRNRADLFRAFTHDIAHNFAQQSGTAQQGAKITSRLPTARQELDMSTFCRVSLFIVLSFVIAIKAAALTQLAELIPSV